MIDCLPHLLPSVCSGSGVEGPCDDVERSCHGVDSVAREKMVEADLVRSWREETVWFKLRLAVAVARVIFRT